MEDGSSDVQSVFVYNGVDEVPNDVIHVRVDQSVTIIPDSAFQYCRQLEVVELPEGLIKIDMRAFDKCRQLMRINIPSTVREIHRDAFGYCEKLVHVHLPDELRRLGRWAFRDCKSLQRINIPPNLETIEYGAFEACYSLSEVLFSEGLREIEWEAFSCCYSLVSVTLPSSLKVIRRGSFQYCRSLNETNLHDTVETIEGRAFDGCNLQNFLMPPLITDVDMSMFENCKHLVSLELSGNITKCENTRGVSLRNITFPSECEVDDYWDTLEDCKDLKRVFPPGADEAITDALKQRFENLPIHKLCYYQSYHDTESTLQNLKQVMDSTGKQQDCLGMTPLHILACSTKPAFEMIRLLIEKYPETLIMKDKWGDIPLVYAYRCNAPSEVLDLLVNRYKLLYPDYEFDWGDMLLTLAKCDVPLPNIQRLVNTQQNIYPNQEYDMQGIVMDLIRYDAPRLGCIPIETLRYLLHVSIAKRLESLNVKRFCEDMESSVSTFSEKVQRETSARKLYDRLTTYESIKEGTSVLELALWKDKIDMDRNKKARVDGEVSHKEQCRVNCGADIVIRNVLPFLLPLPQMDDSCDDSSDESSNDSNESSDSSSIVDESDYYSSSASSILSY